MKIWVICSGEAPVSRESRYDPAGYAAYREALLEGEPPAEGVKAARGEGFLLYVSPHAAAQRSWRRPDCGGAARSGSGVC